jgi:hypothetical protein
MGTRRVIEVQQGQDLWQQQEAPCYDHRLVQALQVSLGHMVGLSHAESRTWVNHRHNTSSQPGFGSLNWVGLFVCRPAEVHVLLLTWPRSTMLRPGMIRGSF